MSPCLHIIAHMDMDMAPCPYSTGYWHIWDIVSMSAYYCSHGYGYGSMSAYYLTHMDMDILTHMDLDMTPCLHIINSQ